MQQNTIEIGQYESGNVSYPDIITSGGMWPCIAVGILDKKEKKAYLIHEANASVDENLPSFIENILNQHHKTNLSVYVAGGAVLEEEDEDQKQYIIDHKLYVEEKVRSFFDNDQITFCWAENSFTELSIDTLTNEFKINKLS